jgi:hypothetical protein
MPDFLGEVAVFVRNLAEFGEILAKSLKSSKKSVGFCTFGASCLW